MNRITKARRRLAAGILIQARRDLRRYHAAKTAVKRELYLDARHWVASDSCHWSFSFRNVCGLLDLPPEETRRALFEQTSLDGLHYWGRRCGYALRQFHLFLRRDSSKARNPDPSVGLLRRLS
jgi:hypothetical protein